MSVRSGTGMWPFTNSSEVKKLREKLDKANKDLENAQIELEKQGEELYKAQIRGPYYFRASEREKELREKVKEYEKQLEEYKIQLNRHNPYLYSGSAEIDRYREQVLILKRELKDVKNKLLEWYVTTKTPQTLETEKQRIIEKIETVLRKLSDRDIPFDDFQTEFVKEQNRLPARCEADGQDAQK